MSSKLIYGVGFNDGTHPTVVRGKSNTVYTLWKNLLRRCYDARTQEKNPTYISCTVSENFKSFSFFYEWTQKQISFNQDGFQLDKDVLVKGNKLYSENTCLFLPRELNNLLTSSKAARGILPLGVSKDKGRFRARCDTGVCQYLGGFDSPEEAFQAYKQVKEAFIKSQAEKWKAHIDPRAFAALMAYEVSITD